MWVARVMVVVMFFCVAGAVADESRGHAMLNRARSGVAAMEAHYEALRGGAAEVAEEKRVEAGALFDEVTLWGMGVDPEGFDGASEAAQFGKAMELAGQYDLAARGYRRAFELEGGEADALGAARNYRLIGSAWFDDAIGLLAQVGDETSNAEVHAELAVIYQSLSLVDLSGASWDRALVLDPGSRRALLGKAVVDISQGRVAEGNGVLLGLGELEIELGRFVDEFLPGALARIERRQLTLREDAASHAAYAQLLVRVGRSFDGLFAIEHATRLDDSNASWFNLQGGLLLQQGFRERAAVAYRRSLALNGEQPRTRELLEQAERPGN